MILLRHSYPAGEFGTRQFVYELSQLSEDDQKASFDANAEYVREVYQQQLAALLENAERVGWVRVPVPCGGKTWVKKC